MTPAGLLWRGHYDRCELCALPADLMHFARLFLHVEGNLREVQRLLGLSYPTIKARITAVTTALAQAAMKPVGSSDEANMSQDEGRLRLLRWLRDGQMSLDEVLRRLQEEDFRFEGGNDGPHNP